MRTLKLLTVVMMLVLLPSVSLAKKAAKESDSQLVRHLPRDPVIAYVLTVGNLDEQLDELLGIVGNFSEEFDPATVQAEMDKLDGELGCSLRKDLLARIGPRVAITIDIPPIDEAAGLMANPAVGIPRLLGGIGILADTQEIESLNGCMRNLFAMAGGKLTNEEGLVRVSFELPQEGAPEIPEIGVYYGFRDGLFSLGFSSGAVRASLEGPGEGLSLADGADFTRVFAHLDKAPQTLTYVNMPKIRERVAGSQMIQGLISTQPDAKPVLDLFMGADFTGMGVGSTSVEVDGGTRTTTFGPSGLSGGAFSTGMIAAIAVPNLLNAIDRGKQKRTMADMRSIGTAIEMFSIDNNVYPGPTEGWVPVDRIESSVSPMYIRVLPPFDGWGHPLMVWSDGDNYMIVSPGKDGQLSREWTVHDEGGSTAMFADDIVFGNGSFVQWPEGKQQ